MSAALQQFPIPTAQQPQMSLRAVAASATPVREQLTGHLESRGITKTAAARAMGIGDATLSEWIGGKYKGDNERIERKVLRYLNLARAREENRRLFEFTETSYTRAIQQCLSVCHRRQELGVIYGDAGVGKTLTAMRYAQEQDGVYIVATAVVRTPRAFLTMLASALGLPGNASGTILYYSIVKQLSGGDTIIVVDEAQHMSATTLEVLRQIHDHSRAPVVLVGNDWVYDRLTQGKGAPAFAQILSRVMNRLVLRNSRLSDDDIRSFCEAANTSTVVSKEFGRLARSPVGLRRAIQILQLAWQFADGGRVNEEHWESAKLATGGQP